MVKRIGNRSRALQAELNFLRPMTVQPLLDVTGATGGNLELETREVELADADAEQPVPNIATHGFGAVPFEATLPEHEVDAAYRRHFAALCAAAVKRATGAALVIGAPMGVQLRHSQGIIHQEGPLSITHGDFTPLLAAQRAAQVLT